MTSQRTRERLIQRLMNQGITRFEVLEAIRSVPRHLFVDEALAQFPDLQTIWMQIGVIHDEAAEKARDRGVDVVMNRCPKIEYQRLFGELRMGGFNTGVISSKL